LRYCFSGGPVVFTLIVSTEERPCALRFRGTCLSQLCISIYSKKIETSAEGLRITRLIRPLPQGAASSQSQAPAQAQPAQDQPVVMQSTSEDSASEVRTLTLTMKDLDEEGADGGLDIANDGKDVQMQEEDRATN